jgi:hypothetical protein
VSFVVNYWQAVHHHIHDIDAFVKSVDAYLLYPHRSTQESEMPLTISGGFTTKATGELITILLPDLLPECLPPKMFIKKYKDLDSLIFSVVSVNMFSRYSSM